MVNGNGAAGGTEHGARGGEPVPGGIQNVAVPRTADVEIRPLKPAPRTRPAPAPADEPTLADILWTLYERKVTVALVTIAAFAIAAAYLVVATPVFESRVLLRVEGGAQPVAAFRDLATLFDANTPTEGEMQILRSRPLLGTVIDQLGLDLEIRPRTLPVIGAAVVRRHEGPPGPALFGLDAYAWGGERLHVQRLEISSALVGEKLVVTALDGDRYRVSAATDGAVLAEGRVGTPAAGAAGDRRVEMVVSELEARPGTQFFVTKLRRLEVIEQLQTSLDVAEQGRNTGIVGVTMTGEDPNRIVAILDAMASNYLRQSVERTSAEAAKTLQILEAQLPVVKANLDRAENALNRFRQTKGTVNLSAEAESLLQRLGDVDRQIAEEDLRRAEGRQYTAQYPDTGGLQRRSDLLQGQRASLEARMRTLPDLELESSRLTRQVNVATDLYLLVLNRAEELRIVKSGWIGNARILENATEPYRPSRPKRAAIVLFSLALGLFGGIAVALVRSAMDKGIRDPEEVESGTGLPVFATIPRSPEQRKLMRRRRAKPTTLAQVDAGAAAVEDLRSLRTSIQFALLRAPNNLVAIGGMAPGDGKSFVSANLAYLLGAADGGRVLLVDADLRRGAAHRIFGLDAEPGLAEVVAGKATLESALHPTGVASLDVLPAGRLVQNPAELLAGPAFQGLLEELGRRYKVVVVDAPPVSVSDAALVARHVGLNLLVLRSGDHSVREVSSALRRLAQNGVTFRGVILNDVRSKWGRSHGPYNRFTGADA